MKIATVDQLFDDALLSRDRLAEALRLAAPKAWAGTLVPGAGLSPAQLPEALVRALPGALRLAVGEGLCKSWWRGHAGAGPWPATLDWTFQRSMDWPDQGWPAFALRIHARVLLVRADTMVFWQAGDQTLRLGSEGPWSARLELTVADADHRSTPSPFYERQLEVYLDTGPWPLRAPASAAQGSAAADPHFGANTMLTATQKATALAIVNLFETSSVRGNYGAVTVLAGDSGHLTFGRSQTTLASDGGPGGLATLLAEYCAAPGARYARLLLPYVQRCSLPDLALDQDQGFQNLLRASADDVVMRDVQDQFFDVRYWQKALTAAASHGLISPLAVATVYDSLVHGSWGHVRGLADGNAGGTPAQVGQDVWLPVYIQTRRHWLANHPTRPLLHSTVYRMDALQRLIDFELWDLPLPIVVRGAEINLVTLAAEPPGCFSGPAPGTRALAVQGQMQRGLDVRLFQLGLSEAGIEVVADGLFGFGARRALHAHQQQQGLPVSDVADAALVERLARSVS